MKTPVPFLLVATFLVRTAIPGPGLAQESESSGARADPAPPSTATGPAHSPTTNPDSASPASATEVFLITIGPGRQVWERFGHNAIWVRDTLRGIDRAYNYGMFSFDDPGFLMRFVRGEMNYWMEGFDTERMLRAYAAADRSIWVQELDLTPEQTEALYEFERWNEQPANRSYRYDYYRDNCSTRVRDAIDRVLGGRLRESTEPVETGTTYRSHFRRLMAPDPPIYTGGSFAIGPATDRPISAWEEMFLPVRMREYVRGVSVPDGQGGERPLVKREFTIYESTLGPEPQAPPDWRLRFLAIGAALGGLLVLLGLLGSRWRPARLVAAVASSAWALLLGVGGLFMLGIWFLTAHWAGYRNENLFFLNPVALALVFLIPVALLTERTWACTWARRVAIFIAALAVLGLIIQPLPWFPQRNAEIIAAALPPTLAMAWVVLRLTDRGSPRARGVAAGLPALILGAVSGLAGLVLGTAPVLQAQPATDSVAVVTGVEDAYGYWSPDGTRIVFQSNRAGQWDIYVINADGSGLERLTEHPAHDRTPVWSPDGSSIAFQSERDGDREIYVMGADGSDPQNITNHPAEDSHPKWSPDGRRIVFDSDRDRPGDYELYEMSADGSRVVRLTDYADWDTYSSISPDGEQLLWRRVTSDGETRNSEVFVMDRDGSDPTNLSNHAAFDGWPAWSPDGSRILFASDRAGSRVWHLYTVAPDGSDIVRLTAEVPADGYYTQPMWSPDGSRIVATRYLGAGSELVVLHLGSQGRTAGAPRTAAAEPSSDTDQSTEGTGWPTGEWFVSIEDGELVTDGNLSRGVAWGDLDGDGYPDLAVANTINQPEFLYRNEGDGTFTQLVENPITLAAGWTEGAAWVDFDDDGDLDLFTTNANKQPNGLFRNDAGGFEPVQAGALTDDATSSTMSCWADYDGDGDLDVLVVNRDGEDDALYRNDGSARFEPIRGTPLVGNGGQGRACGAADADGDGDVDLYIGNGRRQRNYYYRNEGDWRFREITEGAFVQDTAYSYGVSWVDYDYDDDLDLYVTNIAESNALYVNDGAGSFTPLQESPLVTDGGVSKGQTWGDFDNDGDLDLFIANGTEAPDMRNFLYRNGGPAGFVRVMEGAIAAHADTSAGAAAADYDRDGDLDLFVANWGGGDEDNRLYRNETTGRSWIAIRLEGRRSNRFGFGARLRLKATIGGRSYWQTRWLLPATGYASGDEPVVHFGLGDAAVVEALEVHWPSGTVDRHATLRPGAFYVASEGEGIRQQGEGGMRQ